MKSSVTPNYSMRKHKKHIATFGGWNWYWATKNRQGANNCFVWSVNGSGEIGHVSPNLVTRDRNAMIKYALLHTPLGNVPKEFRGLYEEALEEARQQQDRHREDAEYKSIERCYVTERCTLRVASWVINGSTNITDIDDLPEHIDVIFDGEVVGTLESFISDGIPEEVVTELEEGNIVERWLVDLFAAFGTYDVPPELLGVREVAEFIGWLPAKVSTYYKRGKLPEPVQVLASGPIWTRQQIEEYRDSINAPTVE